MSTVWRDGELHYYTDESTSMNSDGIVCPFCGCIHAVGGFEGDEYDDGMDEYDCDECGETFDVEVHSCFSWSSTKPDDNKL